MNLRRLIIDKWMVSMNMNEHAKRTVKKKNDCRLDVIILQWLHASRLSIDTRDMTICCS